MRSFAKDTSLRERKQAKTKIFIVKEFLEKLKETKYENISIRSICEKAEISEGTFYNYFPQKIDLFNYSITLYGTKGIMETNEKVSKDAPIKWIKAYFENAVSMIIDMGNLSNEIMVTLIRERVKPQKMQITKLEFMNMFPEIKNIDAFQDALSMEECFDEVVETMSQKNLFKKDIATIDVCIALKLIFGGIPLVSAVYPDQKLDDIVKKQISIVLQGVLK